MTPEKLQTLITWGWILATVALFYFVLIRPQKKREKKDREMMNALQVGDTIVTIGGICGKIISIKENVINIETGADKTKLQLEKWSVRSIETPKAQ